MNLSFPVSLIWLSLSSDFVQSAMVIKSDPLLIFDMVYIFSFLFVIYIFFFQKHNLPFVEVIDISYDC